MFKRVMAIGMGVTALLSTGYAGSMDKTTVSSDAKWVIHFDMEKFNSSKLWTRIQAEDDERTAALQAAAAQGATNSPVQQFTIKNGLVMMKLFLGVNPVTDIKSVTAYGNNYKPGACVVIVKGTVDTPNIRMLMEKNANKQEMTYSGKQLISSGTAEGNVQKGAVCFYGPDVTVMSDSIETLKKAVDVLDKNAADLTQGNMQLPDTTKCLIVAAAAVENQIGNEPSAAIFKNARWITVTADEKDANIAVETSVCATTADQAVQIEQVIRGLSAYVGLAQNSDPKIADIIKNISVTRDGQVVKGSFSCSIDELFDTIKERCRAMLQQRLKANVEGAVNGGYHHGHRIK